MKQWSPGYEALRTYVRFAFWLTHKRIVVTGRENIPDNKPIIFAANHQNALMDPLALVCTNPLQTLWLARADIFKSKAARPILKFMKMIPIYRIRDGKENLSNNEQIFDQVSKVLEERQSVALFPEAAHSGKRQMLPHKKAIPRIAMEAEEKNDFGLDLQIVPVGIYYDHYWNFNRTLFVQYGATIEIDKYKSLYLENPQNSMLLLRDEIHSCLSPLTMEIKSEKYYQDYEQLRMVAGKEYSKLKSFSKNPVIQLFKSDQELMAKIECLEEAQPVVFEQLLVQTHNYEKQLRNSGFSDSHLSKSMESGIFKFLIQGLLGVALFPVFAFGFIFNALPYFIPRIILARKVKDPAFLSTFFFVAGLVLFPVIYLIEFSLILLFTHSAAIGFTSLVAMPFAGKVAWNLLQLYKKLGKIFTLRVIRVKLYSKLKKARLGLIHDIIKNIEVKS
jgi:1-acyl-sn-glycerol-3-phosphate acyltransferase